MIKTPEIILKGHPNGDGMVIHYCTSAGTDVYGLAVPNLRQFDLGPTWCYLVCGKSTTLIDTGRPGGLNELKTLIKAAGREFAGIDRIILTHNHEDHDGSLPDIMVDFKGEVWAHSLYPVMICYYPDSADAKHRDLPASCRHCVLPESVYSHCMEYQKRRSVLKIGNTLEDNEAVDGFRFIHTPGHSVDSLCILLEDEILFTGDTLLPDITPHPTLASYLEEDRCFLPEKFSNKDDVYGLISYIRSLQKLAFLTENMSLVTLPAHRYYTRGKFNTVESCAVRAREIIRFHIARCDDIIRIIKRSPATVDDIVLQHFPEKQLRGFGRMLAVNEILAHLEVMEDAGDINWTGSPKERQVVHTGTYNYREKMAGYLLSPA